MYLASRESGDHGCAQMAALWVPERYEQILSFIKIPYQHVIATKFQIYRKQDL
jgi:hypothetical protein